MITLIRGSWVVGYDNGKQKIVRDGEVAFEDDKIIYVGTGFPGTADRVFDAPGCLVSPGFINLHSHPGVEIKAEMIDLPESGPNSRRIGVKKEIAEGGFPFEQSLTPHQQRASALVGLTQLVRHGSTTIFDPGGSGPLWWLGNPWGDEELLVEEAGRLGLRLYCATAYRSWMGYRDADGNTHYMEDLEGGWRLFHRAVEFAETYHGAYGGRVLTALSPHAVDNTHPEILKATKEAADERGWLIQVHAAQSTREVQVLRKRHGVGPIELLEQIGFLGDNVLLGHTIYIDRHSADNAGDSDLDRLARTGTSIVHSPLPFARAGQVLQTLPEYLDRGVTVALGTDIWPADMVRELNLAWMLGKVAGCRADRPTAWEVYEAATLGGAAAVGRSDIGRLEAGALADIIIVDLSRPDYGPISDPIRALVTSGAGTDVRDVFVDGRHILVNGEFPGLDRCGLLEEAYDILYQWCDVASQRDPRDINVVDRLVEPGRGLDADELEG